MGLPAVTVADEREREGGGAPPEVPARARRIGPAAGLALAFAALLAVLILVTHPWRPDPPSYRARLAPGREAYLFDDSGGSPILGKDVEPAEGYAIEEGRYVEAGTRVVVVADDLGDESDPQRPVRVRVVDGASRGEPGRTLRLFIQPLVPK
jgi:hypothetical protein